MTHVSQTRLIRDHLERHGSITPLTALRLYGCMRLGGRIHELRQAGMPITTTTPDAGKRYAIYTLPSTYAQVELFGAEVVA